MVQGLRNTPLGHFLRGIGFQSGLLYPEEKADFIPPTFSTVVEVEDKRDVEFERSISKISAILDVSERELLGRLPARNMSAASIVSWYDDKDEENPRNWSDRKKGWVIVIMTLYTFVVYCTASIITPTSQYLVQQYHVSIDVANLPLLVYVVGYGVGPMFFSPMSEIPFIGRNPPYLGSFVLFLLVSIMMAAIDNLPALIVLRFLQGLFGSPILASGLATIGDIYDMYSAPYGYIWWTAAIYCGPALGPLLPAWAVAHNWRWALWVTLIMSSVMTLLLLCLPETSHSKIILGRARRLRQATGNASYLAPSELNPVDLAAATFRGALMKPMEISVKDPAIALTAIYGSIVYATYYSFFECFPIVYLQIYRLPLYGLGLVFTGSLCGGCALGVLAYWTYLRHYFIPRARYSDQVSGSPVPQEVWLWPGLPAVFGPPLGLLLFAWTARADVHYMVPTLGIALFAASSFCVFQSLICYIPLTYPKYVASLFAANDLARSLTAAAMLACSRHMYENLGVARGVTLVAGLSAFGVLGLWYLYYDGARLRAKSRFTTTP